MGLVVEEGGVITGGEAKVEHAAGCCKSFCFGVWWEVIKVEEFTCVGGIIRGEAREVTEKFAWVG